MAHPERPATMPDRLCRNLRPVASGTLRGILVYRFSSFPGALPFALAMLVLEELRKWLVRRRK
jgi:hypothetical protein